MRPCSDNLLAIRCAVVYHAWVAHAFSLGIKRRDHTVWHLIPALNAWAARAIYTTACLIATSRFLGMDEWMTSQLKIPLIRKLCGSLMWLAYCLTCHQLVSELAHWLTSGRQVAGIKCLYCRPNLAYP